MVQSPSIAGNIGCRRLDSLPQLRVSCCYVVAQCKQPFAKVRRGDGDDSDEC